MLVDNVAFERITLKDIIAQAGHEVVAEVNNGCDVLKTYEKTSPNLVIMDINLPDCEGIEILRELMTKHSDAVVCVCTALAQQALIIEAIQLGIKDFIVKPYNTERIRTTMQKFLGQ